MSHQGHLIVVAIKGLATSSIFSVMGGRGLGELERRIKCFKSQIQVICYANTPFSPSIVSVCGTAGSQGFSRPQEIDEPSGSSHCSSH